MSEKEIDFLENLPEMEESPEMFSVDIMDVGYDSEDNRIFVAESKGERFAVTLPGKKFDEIWEAKRNVDCQKCIDDIRVFVSNTECFEGEIFYNETRRIGTLGLYRDITPEERKSSEFAYKNAIEKIDRLAGKSLKRYLLPFQYVEEGYRGRVSCIYALGDKEGNRSLKITFLDKTKLSLEISVEKEDVNMTNLWKAISKDRTIGGGPKPFNIDLGLKPINMRSR